MDAPQDCRTDTKQEGSVPGKPPRMLAQQPAHLRGGEIEIRAPLCACMYGEHTRGLGFWQQIADRGACIGDVMRLIVQHRRDGFAGIPRRRMRTGLEMVVERTRNALLEKMR